MPLALLRAGRGPNPVSFLAALLVLGGGLTLVRDRITPIGDDAECESWEDPECELEPEVAPRGVGGFTAPTLPAETACRSAGYLCAEIDQSGVVDVRRWRDHQGPLVVLIPLPDLENRAAARRLRNAAAQGVKVWNDHPFPISVVERAGNGEDFPVRWSSSLGGRQLGVARTGWSMDTGLQVVELRLATHSPFAPDRILDERQVRLTAAHEMGHALGLLMHSDSERDVMYPTNTATSLSARDYRTMEVLYGLEDGTRIVR